jgi:hypothetical protein
VGGGRRGRRRALRGGAAGSGRRCGARRSSRVTRCEPGDGRRAT